MVKYTHLIERCSSFLRTGVAWKLNEHGYTFSEAYWRLREGKGLLSGYDRESLNIWASLITSVRRNTAAAIKLNPEDQAYLKEKRSCILDRMEAYRDKLENGCKPKYLYDNSFPFVVEHLMVMRVGDPRKASSSEQQVIWKSMDIDSLQTEVGECMKAITEYETQYATATDNEKQDMPNPEEWATNTFAAKFIKDKVWQIRVGHDDRSSVGAGINDRLLFIWDIPSMTDERHRMIYEEIRLKLESYQQWKDNNNIKDISYEDILSRAKDVLNYIQIPDF